MWTIVKVEDVLPPNYKIELGRPTKLRSGEPDEDPNGRKSKRQGTSYRCTNCDIKLIIIVGFAKALLLI